MDAAGLSLFAVAGAAKALDYGIHPFLAVLMGGITGVGGGTVRDLLLARVLTVSRSDIYAVAALAGAAVMVAGLSAGLGPTLMTVAGAITWFVLRVVAFWRHWNLPPASFIPETRPWDGQAVAMVLSGRLLFNNAHGQASAGV
jgi:uncharacterized membrane protein YeiH